MVAGGIVHEEWLNQNANRKYPFFDEVSLKDTSGTMVLPNDLIVDLTFPVNALDYDPAKFYLKQLTVYAEGVVIELGYVGESDAIASRAITDAHHTPYKTYYIEGEGDFEDCVGRITIGKLDNVKRYGGTYTFHEDASRFLPTVLRPSLKGVSALRVINANNEESDLIQGDIELIAGDNIQLEVTSGGGSEPNELRISAVGNTNYEEECDCPDTTSGRCIETINGIAPDNTGNFELNGDGCLTLEAQPNGVKFTDTCADPCCGCTELEVLRSELGRLANQINTQRAFAQRAMANIEQLRDVILASKMGTRPCD